MLKRKLERARTETPDEKYAVPSVGFKQRQGRRLKNSRTGSRNSKRQLILLKTRMYLNF